jgi:hypothetical protein
MAAKITKVVRRDVDGTVPGRAVLLIVNIDDPSSKTGVIHQVFVEGEHNCTDPNLSAQGLWESISADWPDHIHTIVQNERARYLMTARRMKEIFGADYPVDDHLGIKET